MKRNRGRGVGGLEETLINALMGGAVVEKKIMVFRRGGNKGRHGGRTKNRGKIIVRVHTWES
jgi:hypothetical protein